MFYLPNAGRKELLAHRRDRERTRRERARPVLDLSRLIFRTSLQDKQSWSHVIDEESEAQETANSLLLKVRNPIKNFFLKKRSGAKMLQWRLLKIAGTPRHPGDLAKMQVLIQQV